MKKFDLTSRQAKTIILMPLDQLTGLKREQVKRQIQTLRKEIAENRFQPRQKKPMVNVVALKMVPTLLRDKISLPGFIEPWIRLEVSSEVKGKVNKLEIEEGDLVRKGDILAVLDSRDFENSYRSAKASYEAALATQKRLKELYKGKLSTRNDLDNAIARSEQYKATRDNLALDIDRCTIRAPISGVVNHLFIEEGQYLKEASKVVEILKIDRVKVQVGIPESDVNAVRRLNSFDVDISALGGKRFRASKRFLSKTAHNMARLYGLELELANPDGEILPDMFARVEIVKKEISDGLAVPLYAVISRNDDHIVYVLNDTHAHSRRVKLGFQEGWMVAIEKGLSAGEQVIVMGQRSVNDGQKVNVVRSVTDIEDLRK
jgi:RND family efflux transporter MFP subunit